MVNFINKKGYSLIEVIVSLAIIGIVFSFSLLLYKKNSTPNFISNDSYVLKTSLIKAMNMAISGDSNTKFTENNNFGTYFVIGNNYFYIYKDLNLNNTFENNEIIETVKLSNSSINSTSSGNSLNLLFKSNGDTYLNGSKTSSSNINLSIIYKTFIKTIYFNSRTKTINIQ